MQTHRTKTFQSGNSQAVRLPKALAFPEGTELEMIKEGSVIRLRPVRLSFEDMVTELRKLPKPTSVEIRDTEEIPERPRL
jgi:antitoxin VapB